jgi:ParB family transcriptional regulator, chromosome partitioning protein
MAVAPFRPAGQDPPLQLASLPDESVVRRIPLDRLRPAEDNPRELTGDVQELARSVRAVGILQPLVVTPDGADRYLIVCGERRWKAAELAHLDEVPCVVRLFDDRERQEAMLIENLQRRTLRPIEEARAYERLMTLGHTQTQIAGRVGRSQGHISRRLALLTLPAGVRHQVDRREVPLNQALGYESAPPADAFDADERLQDAWLALRQEVIEVGNRRLARLLHEFARAYIQRTRFYVRPKAGRAHVSRGRIA